METTMKINLAAAAALLALAALSLPASAGQRDFGRHDPRDVVIVQDRDFGRSYGDDRRFGRGDRFDGVIPERRIVRRLMRDGFVSVEDIDLRRDRYVVRAVRPNGALIRLAIDAYDGEILSRERIGWARERGYRGRPDDRRDRSGIEFDFGTGSLGIYER